jgi:hypothetical protein
MDAIEFPRFMCRKGGPWELETGRYSVQMVADQAALDEAWADGWRFDQYAARDVGAELVESPEPEPLTRAELEAKAKALGLTWHHRTGDAKLAELIAAAEAG